MQLLDWRWADEDEVGFREYRIDFLCSLDVNIKECYQLLLLELVNLGLLRAVKIRMYMAILDEFIASYLSIKSFMINEMVVLSINLAFSWLASGERHTEAKFFSVLLEDMVH